MIDESFAAGTCFYCAEGLTASEKKRASIACTNCFLAFITGTDRVPREVIGLYEVQCDFSRKRSLAVPEACMRVIRHLKGGQKKGDAFVARRVMSSKTISVYHTIVKEKTNADAEQD